MMSVGGAIKSFWHAMTSSDRHASHDSPYRTGQHVPLNQSRHAPLTTVATSAMESRPDLTSPYHEDTQSQFTPGLPNGSAHHLPNGPPSPASPYSPGMRSNAALQRRMSSEPNPFDKVVPGEIQMQSFQEGLPPPPPVQHTWKKIDRWTEENYPELYDQLSAPATQNDVNELEHELDVSLPMEVRESLQFHDGQERGGRPTGILFGCMLLDCEEIVQEWRNWKTVNEEYLSGSSRAPTTLTTFPPKAFGGSSVASSSTAPPSQHAQSANSLWKQQLMERQDSQPPRAIQKTYSHPAWIPLARDWGGNNLAVDLAPGPQGKWGQVIIFGRDYDCKYVVSRSWAAFLAQVADDLNSGRWFVDEDTQELKLREFKTTNVEPGYLDILRWRVDQKFGRRGPRRRPGTNAAPGSPGANGNSANSPYGSPTEERGRSPQRFPVRGGHSSSPVASNSGSGAGVGRPSPLSIVSEEPKAKPIPGAVDTPKKPSSGQTNAQRDDGFIDVNNSPVTSGANVNGVNHYAAKVTSPLSRSSAGILSDATNKDKIGEQKGVSGLGVEGVDEMKNIEI